MSRVKTSLDHKRFRRLIWLVLTVFVLLGYSLQSVAGNVSYSMLIQAYGTVSSPPVILEEGNVTGSSTIYTNKTSAKVSVATPVWLSGWDKRVRITIDNNDVDSALSNFPVLVYLSNSSSGRNNEDVSFVFDELQSDANRKKIAVTTSDGTQCYVEIEKWDDASEQAWLWVEVPSISATSDTDLYLYYDNAHADNTNYVGDPNSTPAENVWDTNFKGVWHMTEVNATDSTSNNNDGTESGGVTYTDSGKIDGADVFDGADDYVSISADLAQWLGKTASLSVWIKTTQIGNDVFWSAPGITGVEENGGGNDVFWGWIDASGRICIQAGDTAGANTTSAINDGNWHHIFMTRNSTSGEVKIYANGILNDTATSDTGDKTNSFYSIGRIEDTGGTPEYFNGTIDEVRISNTTRSDAWIKASYESERDDLLDFGAEDREIDYVDNNTSNEGSPTDRGTHSNFSAQQAGPDSVYDTLTEENTGGITGITPITAFQDTQQSTSSTSLVDANCETSALSNGVNYLVIYCGNIGGNDNGAHVELVLIFGATTIARCTAEGTDQTTVLHVAAGALHGYYIVTGDGTSTLKFQFRCITSLDTAYAGAMGIVAIPLTELTQNSDYWYSVSNTEDVVTNPSTWTNLASQTWSLPETGNYLILMSAEGGCDGSSTSDAPMVRFQLNGATLGSEYMEEWEDNVDNMNFAKATVVNCNSGDNTFRIQVTDEDGTSPSADFHRPRIVVIKCSAFNQIVDTSTSTGVSTISTTYVDWSALTTTYTPNQQEYVVVLANLNGLHSSSYHVPVFQIYDATASTAHREDSGEYGNDGYGTGHGAGADQMASIAVAVKQQSAATQWKVQIRTEDGSTAYYSQTGTGTGHRSDLILWGLSVGGTTKYELDLEVQWTNADYDENNEELAIYVDKEDNTYSLDATGGYMIIGDGTPDWGSTTGTISFWVKMDTSVQGRFYGQDGNMETRWSGTNLVVDWGATDSIISAYSFSADTWYFVAIVWDENNDNLFLYVGDEDNAPTLDANSLSGTWTSTTPAPTENRFLNGLGGTEPVDGHGDDLRYWNVTRSLTEIQSDYNTELTGSENNLRSYFKLNNNFDDTGPDNNDGSGYDGYSFSSDVAFEEPPNENIRVDFWNGTTWQNLFTDLTNGWNNVSVSSYLTSSNFTIRFNGGNETSDTTQNSWKIDVTLLHVWTTENYDYVLEVVNQVADNWTVNLQVYDNSNIGRLSSLNISLHDGTSSNQIAVTGGSIVKSEGDSYNLPGGVDSTIYISMSNLQATTTGTSYLYVHLKILVPNSSTYILYVINFEIS